MNALLCTLLDAAGLQSRSAVVASLSSKSRDWVRGHVTGFEASDGFEVTWLGSGDVARFEVT